MTRPAVVTIASSNYLPQVRVLADSFRSFHAGVPFYLAQSDAAKAGQTAYFGNVELLSMEDLALRDRVGMQRRYDVKAMCAALKPSVLRCLLERGFAPVLFFDPDILITDDLTGVFAECARHSLTLTPHWNTPPAGDRGRSLERRVLLAGIYNGGFIGVMPGAESYRFLSWWEDRLREHCLCELERGIHFDQRWLDLACGFVSDLHLLRDPGCNVAYWNLDVRRLERCGDRFLVDGAPLRFFHFSGFDPASPERVSQFEPGWLVSELAVAGDLFRRYTELLGAAS